MLVMKRDREDNGNNGENVAKSANLHELKWIDTADSFKWLNGIEIGVVWNDSNYIKPALNREWIQKK